MFYVIKSPIPHVVLTTNYNMLFSGQFIECLLILQQHKLKLAWLTAKIKLTLIYWYRNMIKFHFSAEFIFQHGGGKVRQ